MSKFCRNRCPVKGCIAVCNQSVGHIGEHICPAGHKWPGKAVIALIEVICKNGGKFTITGTGQNCEEAYKQAEIQAEIKCALGGGIFKKKRLKCPYP